MRYEIWCNVFGSEYITNGNPDGECYRDEAYANSYEEAKTSAYETFMRFVSWFYKTPRDKLHPVFVHGIMPCTETFDYCSPSGDMMAINKHLKGERYIRSLSPSLNNKGGMEYIPPLFFYYFLLFF